MFLRNAAEGGCRLDRHVASGGRTVGDEVVPLVDLHLAVDVLHGVGPEASRFLVALVFENPVVGAVFRSILIRGGVVAGRRTEERLYVVVVGEHLARTVPVRNHHGLHRRGARPRDVDHRAGRVDRAFRRGFGAVRRVVDFRTRDIARKIDERVAVAGIRGCGWRRRTGGLGEGRGCRGAVDVVRLERLGLDCSRRVQRDRACVLRAARRRLASVRRVADRCARRRAGERDRQRIRGECHRRRGERGRLHCWDKCERAGIDGAFERSGGNGDRLDGRGDGNRDRRGIDRARLGGLAAVRRVVDRRAGRCALERDGVGGRVERRRRGRCWRRGAGGRHCDVLDRQVRRVDRAVVHG